MKIALLSPITYPLPPKSYAPWEKVVNMLAQGLYDRGIDVTVFAAKDSRPAYKVIPTVDLSLDKLHANQREQELVHITKACEIIADSDFDLVNNHINWSGHLPLRNTGKRFVTTIHGFDDMAKYVFSNFKDDNYISISNSVRKKCPDLNYIKTVYNGIDFNKFKLKSIKEDYFFTAARIHPTKGIHNAIKLAKETNTRLYIAGMIHDEEYFEKEIKPEINNLNIVYLGVLSQEEVSEYVSKATAYISLLEWDEPFGLSVAEAIACGTPVIATKRGSMLELVREGITGILVNDVNEAVKRAHEVNEIIPKLCREYGFNMFSVDKMIDGYLDAYTKILNS